MWQSAKYAAIAHSRFSDMPIQYNFFTVVLITASLKSNLHKEHNREKATR